MKFGEVPSSVFGYAYNNINKYIYIYKPSSYILFSKFPCASTTVTRRTESLRGNGNIYIYIGIYRPKLNTIMGGFSRVTSLLITFRIYLYQWRAMMVKRVGASAKKKLYKYNI